MIVQKRWGFGLGTIFSLIVVYFIFLYSKERGWALLAFASKWYLIIAGGLIALSLGIALLVILLSLFVLLITAVRARAFSKRYKNKSKEYIDIEYRVKE